MGTGSSTREASGCNINIFISFHEGIRESLEIAEDLRQFFANWGIPCDVIRSHSSTAAPRDDIKESIRRSTHLLQVLTTDPNPSPWMLNEWHWFDARWSEPMGEHAFVLYSSDHELKSLYSEVEDIRSKIRTGEIRAVPLEEEPLRKFLAALLAKAGVLPNANHEFILPKFCYPPERITFDLLEEHFRDFREANRRGLVRVYPDKRETLKQLKPKLLRARAGECIRMLGFTLRRYVHPTLLDETGRPVENEIGRLFCQAVRERGARARLLILDRAGDAARERMAIESPDVPPAEAGRTVFFGDNVATVAHFVQENLYTPASPDASQVAIRCYRNPYVGMVIFEDELFVELYHLGDDGGTGAEAAQRTICGRVPVLVVRSGTPFYRLFQSHFDRVWERASWAAGGEKAAGQRAG